MALLAVVSPYFMKLVAPLYYIWKAKSGNVTRLRFGNATFYARTGTVDAIALEEIWKFSCYDAVQLHKGDLVVDIGAHIGGYSVKAAKLGARVIAYEASPRNYELLVKNLVINECSKVKTYNVAVASKDGKIELNLDPKWTAQNSIYPVPYLREKISIPCVNLNTVFTRDGLKRIDVLKLDVEGAEYDILLNSRSSYLKKVRRIIIEFHEGMGHGHNVNELEAFLKRNGFRVKHLSMWLTVFLFGTGRLLATRKTEQQSL